jgi:hypothetical protein
MQDSVILKPTFHGAGLRVDWAVPDRLRWILFVALYAVFANVPYWISSRFLGLMPLG